MVAETMLQVRVIVLDCQNLFYIQLTGNRGMLHQGIFLIIVLDLHMGKTQVVTLYG